MIRRTIGENLRELRERKSEDQGRKITQTEVAAVMGVEKNTVWKWEHDKVQLSADQIVRLADLYQVSTDKLLRGGKAENLVMMNETGLSDQTIDRLRELKAKGKTESSEMINLLCDTRFSFAEILPTTGEYLLSAIYNFVHCEEKTLIDNPTKENGFVISLDEILMLQITKDLQRLRDEYQKSRSDSPETGEPIFTDESFFTD